MVLATADNRFEIRGLLSKNMKAKLRGKAADVRILTGNKKVAVVESATAHLITLPVSSAGSEQKKTWSEAEARAIFDFFDRRLRSFSDI